MLRQGRNFRKIIKEPVNLMLNIPLVTLTILLGSLLNWYTRSASRQSESSRAIWATATKNVKKPLGVKDEDLETLVTFLIF